MALSVEILDDESQLDSIVGQWDALAIESGNPYCAPAWMLAWWRNVRGPEAALRAVCVHEGDRLLGLAPLWVADGSEQRAHYEVLTARLSPPATPLVSTGREADVVAAMAKGLAAATPKLSLLRLEGRHADAVLSERLLSAWPGLRPGVHTVPAVPMPIVAVAGRSYEEWLGTKSSKFRQEARRLRRRLDDAGARFSLVGPADLDRALDAFENLHGGRWSERGGSTALVPGWRQMLAEAYESLPEQRLRIFTLELEGRIVAVQILVAAGGEVAGWSGGFDDAAKKFSPAIQLTLHTIEDTAERGEDHLNLGPGGQSYKARLADAEDAMSVMKIIPRGRSYPRIKLRLVVQETKERVGERLGERRKRSLRRRRQD